MTDALPFPLTGTTFIQGPTGAGKTTLTARALRRWLDRHGSDGVVILDFGPDVEGADRRIGGRLDRVFEVPPSVWYGRIDAHGPRSEGSDGGETAALARVNAEAVSRLLESAPTSPTAVFVNDVTIAAHHDLDVLSSILAYCDRGECAVVNGFVGDELGVDDPVSRLERRGIERLRGWADRTVRLDRQT